MGRAPPVRIVPVIADANSMTYVLHKKLGDDIAINRNGRPITLRVVAALNDSFLQGELLMSDANFRRCFPTRAIAAARRSAGRSRRRPGREPRGSAERFRRRRRVNRGTAGRIPSRREHLSFDVPDARRTRAAAGHRRARRGAAAQRARAPARAGAARRGWLRPAAPASHRDCREHAAAGLGLAVGVVRARGHLPAALERGGRLPTGPPLSDC